ncbi:MAG: sigma-70 family RNA polymerase sigma factor [Verrucomicrobiota bacterium]
MNDRSDQQLLQDYAQNRTDPAFAELVRRHIDLVYSAAMRRLGDAHLAEDVAQGTFTALAQNAHDLAGHPVLTGWLHRTTQNIAANLIRTNLRRQTREQEAVTMNQLLSSAPNDANWQSIAPHLDAALDELESADRDMVMLRYFEKKSARETATQLGISEDAAQKRVSRAVDRLREFFAKRGVTVGASGLAVVISANAVQAAPVGLALAISTAAALTGTTLATTATITATKAIAMTALQKTVVAATIAVLAGVGIYEAQQASKLREQVQKLRPLAENYQQLQIERDELNNRLTSLLADNSHANLNSSQTELLRLRGKFGQLTAAAREPGNVAAQEWLARIEALKSKLAQTPAAQIPEMAFLTDEDWLNAAKKDLRTDFDYRYAFASLRNDAEAKFAAMLMNAIAQYALQHDAHEPKRLDPESATFPKEISDLRPYLDPSKVTDDMLSRFEIISPSAIGENPQQRGNFIITQKDAVDPELDQRWAIGLQASGTLGNFEQTEIMNNIKQLAPCLQAYADAHGGAKPNTFADLQPYLASNEQRSAFSKLKQKFPSAHLTW